MKTTKMHLIVKISLKILYKWILNKYNLLIINLYIIIYNYHDQLDSGLVQQDVKKTG